MTAEEIRALDYAALQDGRFDGPEYATFHLLREIAAQLAELVAAIKGDPFTTDRTQTYDGSKDHQ